MSDQWTPAGAASASWTEATVEQTVWDDGATIWDAEGNVAGTVWDATRPSATWTAQAGGTTTWTPE